MTLLAKNPDGSVNLQKSVAAIDEHVSQNSATSADHESRIAVLEAELKKFASIATEVESAHATGQSTTPSQTPPAA